RPPRWSKRSRRRSTVTAAGSTSTSPMIQSPRPPPPDRPEGRGAASIAWMDESVDEGRLRAAIVAAGRRLGARGLIAAREGHLSIRLPHGRALVTSSGRRKDELVPGDLVVVELE